MRAASELSGARALQQPQRQLCMRVAAPCWWRSVPAEEGGGGWHSLRESRCGYMLRAGLGARPRPPPWLVGHPARQPASAAFPPCALPAMRFMRLARWCGVVWCAGGAQHAGRVGD